jgi:hypothetical protein
MKQILCLVALWTLLVASLHAQSPPSYVPTNGLVGWWGFNGNALECFNARLGVIYES